MADSFRTFEDLECWKASRAVRLFITELIKKFPAEEKFNLTDDMKRAARSTTHNIAEGYGRYHYQEFIQFCRYSRGSQNELIDQLITALDDKYISNDEYEKGRELINKAIALINGFINYLERAKLKEEENKKRKKDSEKTNQN
ncbi:MAG: four helix bundle protein [Bacteroidota bacterium]